MVIGEKEKVLALLNEMRIPYQMANHPAVFTIEEMEQLQVVHMDKVAKNLFVRDEKKRNYYLVMMKNQKRANLKELQQRINSSRLSFANEDDLRRYLGLSKGEVSPLGILNDADRIVTVIIDNDLMNDEFVGVHPNDNTATVYISIDDLTKIFKEYKQRYMFINL